MIFPICLVCFDGESTETNAIVFCDYCNIAVHQACYGINEVPDGDFFCDRCLAVKNFESPPSCVICPLTDGAFKKTSEGQWVHLTCALWTPGTWIDFKTMGPVDVTKLSRLGNIRFIANGVETNESTKDSSLVRYYLLINPEPELPS